MQALLLSSCWPWKSYVISLSIKSLPVKWEYYYHLFCGCIIRFKRDNAWEELTHSRYLENNSYCYYYRIQSTGRGTTLHSEETRFWDRDEGGNDRNRWQVTLGWARGDGAPYWCFPCSWWRTRWAHLLKGGTAGRTRFEESREPRGVTVKWNIEGPLSGAALWVGWAAPIHMARFLHLRNPEEWRKQKEGISQDQVLMGKCDDRLRGHRLV